MKSKLLLAIFLLSTQVVLAGADLPESAYRKYQEVNLPKLNAPTVVEIPFGVSNLERLDFLVSDETQSILIPSLLLSDIPQKSFNVSVIDLNSGTTVSGSTAFELPIVNDQIGRAQIVVSGSSITTDSLFLTLNRFVALPNTINISAETAQGLKTILATKSVDSSVINFPQTTANKFIINITYGQPLRVNDLRFGDLSITNQTYKLRFLAQPDHKYLVYFDADRNYPVTMGEMGNLSDNNGVLKLQSGQAMSNQMYTIADTDRDNIPDVRDNCVSVSNPDQADVNQNGRGDACDDFDKDGIVNNLDNCRDLPNYAQTDEDGDEIGDVCDGEESRLTEKYAWLPWVGIVFAALVVIGLFAITIISMRKKGELPPQN